MHPGATGSLAELVGSQDGNRAGCCGIMLAALYTNQCLHIVCSVI